MEEDNVQMVRQIEGREYRCMERGNIIVQSNLGSEERRVKRDGGEGGGRGKEKIDIYPRSYIRGFLLTSYLCFHKCLKLFSRCKFKYCINVLHLRTASTYCFYVLHQRTAFTYCINSAKLAVGRMKGKGCPFYP